MEKKSERLEVRLGYEEKQTFTEACENQGDTPSGAVRRFINGYVRRSDEDVLWSAWRGAAKRRAWKPVAFLTVFGVIAGAFLWISKDKTFVSDEAIFTARDLNNDGQLSGEELEEWDEVLVKVMDVDASNNITLNEFITTGHMAYIESGKKNDLGQKFIPRDGEYTIALEFDISKEHIVILRQQVLDKFAYQSGDIKIDNLDRIVFWHEDGGITVLNGPAGIGVKTGNLE